MSNLNTLFDFSKFEKRKPANQREFEDANKQILIDFKNFVYLAFENLHKKVFSVIEPIDQDKNLNAVVMSGFLKGQMLRKHIQHCHKASKQRFKLHINGTSIYLKKLDESTKLPSNIPTDESIKIHNQLTDSNSEREPIVFLGYTVTEDWSRVTGIYAVCIDGQEMVWISNLTNIGVIEQAHIISLKPKLIAPKVKQGIKRKRAQNE